MLKAEGVSQKFTARHEPVLALNNISLEIKDGEFLSVKGPSGSGKSTLLLTLGGMRAPTQGRVLWDNNSVYDWKIPRRSEWRAQKVGFVFQTFNLIPYLNVFENISIAVELSGNKGIDASNIKKVLDRMALSNRLKHMPNELSVGQQQRVALARALVKNPQIILADEPTGNLDPHASSEILNILIEENKKGKTVVLVTHNPDLAEKANRNITIVDGAIDVI
jgi:putative ABC transport system ATP-binding protein